MSDSTDRRRALSRLLAGVSGLPWLPGLAHAQAAAESLPEAPAPVPRLPVEAFARSPLLRGVSLSPDGAHIAGFMSSQDSTVLVTLPVDGSARPLSLLKTDNAAFHFRWVGWVGPDRVLASMHYPSARYGYDTVETRLVSVHRDGSGLRRLDFKPSQGFNAIVPPDLQIQDRVIDWMADDGRHVLVVYAEGQELWPAVYKVDPLNGERTVVQRAQRGVREWLTDASHRVRVGIREREGGYEIMERGIADGAAWRVLWSFDRDGENEVWPLSFGSDPHELWVQAWHDGRKAVFTVDLRDATLTRTLRRASPGMDIEGGLMHMPLTGEVLGLRFTPEAGAKEERNDIWEPDLRAVVLAIDRQLPGRFNRLTDLSNDGQRYLIYSSGNGQPGQYFVGHRSRGELKLLADLYPGLRPGQLVGKQKLRITARDGLVMNAYLSRPAGSAPGQPLPLVLLPHGGPASRDDVDFDTWTEFLANRGYAVLQVNFRGSDGSGRAHKLAGLRRWGLEMQDDLTDAAQWAVAQRVADPRRIAIAGGSYGGYAALMGTVKTPQLYRCAISFAGVTDLIDLIHFDAGYVGGAEAVEAQIGRVWGDRERLRATSPALQASRIQVPVLLFHGSADRVVPVAQGRDMAAALRSAGKEHRYVEQEGGDHHLSRYAHRLAFFQAMEAFLAQHLA